MRENNMCLVEWLNFCFCSDMGIEYLSVDEVSNKRI